MCFREISLNLFSKHTLQLKSVLTSGNLSCKTWIACLIVKHKTRSSIVGGIDNLPATQKGINFTNHKAQPASFTRCADKIQFQFWKRSCCMVRNATDMLLLNFVVVISPADWSTFTVPQHCWIMSQVREFSWSWKICTRVVVLMVGGVEGELRRGWRKVQAAAAAAAAPSKRSFLFPPSPSLGFGCCWVTNVRKRSKGSSTLS